MSKIYQTLKVQIDGRVGRLSLARPSSNNAINGLMLKELIDVSGWLNEQPELMVVIVEGEGDIFCAGADIKDLPIKAALPDSGKSWSERRAIGQQGKQMVDVLASLKAITVAKVQGAAIGGGLLIMLACDFRILAEDVVLSIPEVALGVPLAWGGIPRLVREVGPSKAKSLVMTCKHFSATDALSMGLAYQICATEDLEQEVMLLTHNLLDKPSVPLLLTKEHINVVAQQMASTDNSFSEGDLLLGIAQDPESKEAVNRYIAALKKRS